MKTRSDIPEKSNEFMNDVKSSECNKCQENVKNSLICLAKREAASPDKLSGNNNAFIVNICIYMYMVSDLMHHPLEFVMCGLVEFFSLLFVCFFLLLITIKMQHGKLKKQFFCELE